MYKIKENRERICLFLKRCRENVEFINKEKEKSNYKDIKTVFTIASTRKIYKNLIPYSTPSRFNKYFYVTGCVVFTQSQAILVANGIDGFVDIIAVDAEKKIPILVSPDTRLLPEDIIKKTIEGQKTVEITESGNLTSVCYEHIKKSKFYEFKPNDLAVDSVWTFVSNLVKVLSGKKISIIGAGNIGTKLALKFVESGANVHINRRDNYKGDTISNALNLIKPESSISNVSYSDSILKSCFLADVIIGCTDGKPVIQWEHIAVSKKESLVIDVGKGSITKEAIVKAYEVGKNIYRTDISAALDAHLIMVIRNDEIVKSSMGKRIIDGVTIISGGLCGKEGDIVVDNVNSPKVIIGIANGEGDFIRDLTYEQLNLIKKLKKKFQ